MAEIFKEHGFTTAAIVNSPKFDPSMGLSRGFEHFQIVAPYETEPWLSTVQNFLATPPRQPLFLFLHILDPHAPYTPAEPLRDAFHAPYSGRFNGHIDWFKRRDGGSTAAGYQLIDVVRAWYHSEILEVDEALGSVVERLKALGLWDDSVVIVLSDHGEEFLDHGGLEHSHTLYDELLRVPLLIRAPGWPEGQVVEPQVRTVDLLPTVLDLFGLPAPHPLSGAPLSPFLREETGPAISEKGWNGELAWRSHGEKIRYDLLNHKALAYFDLLQDPAERKKLFHHSFDRVAALSAEIEEWLQKTPQAAMEESSLDPATREAIEALGYTAQ